MKTKLKNKLHSFYSRYSLKIFNRFYFKIASLFKGKQIDTRSNTVFLIPPTDGGSLGDEAMIVSSINHMVKKGKDVYLITSDSNLKEKLSSYNIVCNYVYIPKLYQGFFAFRSFSKNIKHFKPESVYLIGADVMDGFYSKLRSLTRLSLLDIASSYTKDVRLLGFSMNANPDLSIIKYMKNIDEKVTFLSRDPVSSSRLTQRSIKNKLVADLAFGLEPNQNFYLEELTASEWVHKFHTLGGYICINLNAIHLNEYGQNYFESVCECVKKTLALTNKHILFVSHDVRSFAGVTDLSFSKSVAESLNLSSPRDFTIAPETLNAENLKYLASQADFLITGRMHFAIGGLGAGIPSLMFGYQGKQEGLAKHFEATHDELIVNPTLDTATMVNSIENFIMSLDKLKIKIKNRTDRIKALSLSNFD